MLKPIGYGINISPQCSAPIAISSVVRFFENYQTKVKEGDLLAQAEVSDVRKLCDALFASRSLHD